MTNRIELGEVEAGLIDRFDFDLRERRCSIGVVVHHDIGVSTSHVLEARDVMSLSFHNEYEGPWEVVELSECVVTVGYVDAVLEIEFWGPGAGLEIRAREVLLDERVLG